MQKMNYILYTPSTLILTHDWMKVLACFCTVSVGCKGNLHISQHDLQVSFAVEPTVQPIQFLIVVAQFRIAVVRTLTRMYFCSPVFCLGVQGCLVGATCTALRCTLPRCILQGRKVRKVFLTKVRGVP